MIAAAGPSAMWYLTRGAGAVTLVVLTASVVLGIVHADRRRPAGAPRLLVDAAHRTFSLLALAVLAVHILTSVLDGYAPIGLAAAVVPLASAYRPLWVGLGALAVDLLLAVTVTSLVRARLGYRAWRGVHWLAYACCPVAVVHGLGTGSDVRSLWLALVTLACSLAVLGALGFRLAGAGPGHGLVRGGSLAAVLAAVLGLALWLPAGPLARGWARRAGTPPTLLAAPARAAAPPRERGFASRVTGTVRQGLTSDGTGVVNLSLRLTDGGGRLVVRLAGQPLDGGGLAMRSSSVTLRHGALYEGRVERLSGSAVDALVGSADGRALRLRLRLKLAATSVDGRLSASPATGTRG